ncbi:MULTISPECIES: TetR/AcrR family transcriptional regulator [Marinomonas]|uniref:Helix-turn-helix transcriptional regulator n=1 Tax=Marinomonas arctica TaxID=383750 RepID=A0A7H1J709_9GAMM|nr:MULTISPECIES: TetR/AcrR family transcriptional regulator [Marinomonas]MCS7485680.1 transcriptional regulator [Marinomonas sp. BSi20414]QNT06275.1 helix-turn-helix transcriptional regulator [Marinomonas arctica]GGN28916.1 TetR family transcriptional regulator [Marinomonas arctica]
MTKPDLLIHAAFKLFYEHGIHAVGINRILQETGVAKKTLYHHFASKDALLEAVLMYRDQIFMDWLTSRMMAAGEGKMAVLALFDALDDWFHDRVEVLLPFKGCFFMKANGEFSDHMVNSLCQRHKHNITAFIQANLVGHSAHLSSAELAQSISVLKEGAISQAYVAGDLDAAKRAKAMAVALLSEK